MDIKTMNLSSDNLNLNKSTIIILCTLPNNKNFALKLIKILLDNKLAACITLLHETQSFYYWNDKFENQIEFQLLIKTKKSLKKDVFKKIKTLHPYKLPELLVIPIISGEINYLNWIHSTLK